MLALVFSLSSAGCYVGRHGYYRGGHVYRPWVGAAIVTAAILGTAAIAAASEGERYRAESCRYRTWYQGRWVYYCGDRWAFYEGGVWYAYPPAQPPEAPPPPPGWGEPASPPGPPPPLPPPSP